MYVNLSMGLYLHFGKTFGDNFYLIKPYKKSLYNSILYDLDNYTITTILFVGGGLLMS